MQDGRPLLPVIPSPKDCLGARGQQMINMESSKMKKLGIIRFFPLLILLAGCAAPAVVSDINDSALKVQANTYTPMGEVWVVAREGCKIYNKRPVSISYQCRDQYCIRKQYLFACK